MRRTVKKEKQEDKATESVEPADAESAQLSRQEDAANRRVLRSKYLAVKTKINGIVFSFKKISSVFLKYFLLIFIFLGGADARDEISSVDSNKFNIIINEVDNLHQQGFIAFL